MPTITCTDSNTNTVDNPGAPYYDPAALKCWGTVTVVSPCGESSPNRQRVCCCLQGLDNPADLCAYTQSDCAPGKTFANGICAGGQTASPSLAPTVPTNAPTSAPTAVPSTQPTTSTPTAAPTSQPSWTPTIAPSSAAPTTAPTTAAPTVAPSIAPTTSTPTSAPTHAPTDVLSTLFAVPGADAFREDGSSGALVGGLLAVALVDTAGDAIFGTDRATITCGPDAAAAGARVVEVAREPIEWRRGSDGAWGFSRTTLNVRPIRAGVNRFTPSEGDRIIVDARTSTGALVAVRPWRVICSVCSGRFGTGTAECRSIPLGNYVARVSLPSYGGGCFHPRVNISLDEAVRRIAQTCVASGGGTSDGADVVESSPFIILGSSSIFTVRGNDAGSRGRSSGAGSGAGSGASYAATVAAYGEVPSPPFDTNSSVWLGGVRCESRTSADGTAIVARAPRIADLNGIGRHQLEIRNAPASGGGLAAGSVCFGSQCDALRPTRLHCAATSLCAPSAERGVEVVEKCLDAYYDAGDGRCKKESSDRVCGARGGEQCCWIGQGDQCRACPGGCLCPGGDYCYAREGWCVYFMLCPADISCESCSQFDSPPLTYVMFNVGRYSANALALPVRCDASDLATARRKCGGWDEVAGATRCGAGYEGDVCAICAYGYFESYGATCERCPSPASVWINVGCILAFVLALFATTFALVAAVQVR